MNPSILVPTSRHIRKDKFVQYVGEYHLDLLLQFGAVPLLVPSVAQIESHLPGFLAQGAGLLLVEGEDIHPDRYRPAAAAWGWVKETDEVRDQIEFRLLSHALAQGWPVLGICRGCHLLNVGCGGSLYTDVVKGRSRSVAHIDYDNYDGHRHGLDLLPGTWLHELYGVDRLSVNSYHHQGVAALAPRFQPLAYAEDGLLEAYHDPAHPFLVGLQFHPERIQAEHPGHPAIFRRFVAAVRGEKTEA